MAYASLTLTTDGSGDAELSSGTKYNGLTGILMGIGVDVPPGAPGTAHVKVEELDGLKRTLLDVTVGASDRVFYPVVSQQNISGTAVENTATPFMLDSNAVKVTMSAAGSGKEYTVTLMLM